MRCYLASPWFVPRQMENMKKVREQLEEIVDVYSPERDGFTVKENFTERTRRIVANNDLGGIDTTDFVFAICDYDDLFLSYKDNPKENGIIDSNRIFKGFDSGTLIEISYAVGRGKPVLALFPSTVKTNVMLVPLFLGYTTKIDLCGELTREMLIEKKKFNKAKYINEEISVDKGVLIK